MNRSIPSYYCFAENNTDKILSFFCMHVWSLLVCICLVLSASKTVAQKHSIQFVKGDQTLEHLKKQAKAQTKLIFIYIYEPNSSVCREVENRVFTHQQAALYHNDYFVNYQVNGREPSVQSLVNAFNIKHFPSFLYFDVEGRLIHQTNQTSPTSAYLELVYKVITNSDLPFYKIDGVPDIEGKKIIESTPYNKQPAIPQKTQTARESLSTPASTAPQTKKLFTEQQLEEWEAAYYSRKISTDDLRNYAYALKERKRPYHTVVNQYLKLERTRLRNEINRQFLYDFSETVENDAIHLFLKDIQYFKVEVGSDKINNRIKSAIFNSIQTAIKEQDKVIFEYAIDIISQANLPFKDEFEFDMKMRYYQGVDEWENYTKTAVEYVKTKNITNPQLLNELAFNIAKHSDDTRSLEEALLWAKEGAKIDTEYASNLTLTYVYYRLKQKEKALETAEITLKIAEIRKIDPKEIKDLMDDIKTRL